MFVLFRALTERLKALFAASVAQEFETELLSRDAERRAELLRQANGYAAEGLHAVAARLRQQAETLSLDRPLASVAPALTYWREITPAPALQAPSNNATNPCLPLAPQRRKRAR